jgi:hypothetical protein
MIIVPSVRGALKPGVPTIYITQQNMGNQPSSATYVIPQLFVAHLPGGVGWLEWVSGGSGPNCLIDNNKGSTWIPALAIQNGMTQLYGITYPGGVKGLITTNLRVRVSNGGAILGLTSFSINFI